MIVSLLGLVISLFAYLLAFPESHQRRFDVYGLILAVHIIGSIAYWLLSFESGMDAYLYYRDPFGYMSKSALTSGTHFIVHIVGTLRATLGGSFLDHFLFFQCFGMIGIALLMRSLNEVAESFGARVPVAIYAILLLPGLHFWSAGIGKDALMIMASCMALWASIKIQRRVVWMVIAVLIMAAIRPHVAAITVSAITGALLFSGHLDKKVRLALAPVALIGLIIFIGKAGSQFGITLDPGSFSKFVETQQDFGQQFGSGADLQSLPLPLKILSLLFRPFFFGGTGMMHWAASVENLILLLFFLYVTYHAVTIIRLAKQVFYIAYAIIFSSTLIFLLAVVNYNIGLGQRQKMMAVPAILLLCGTIFLYNRYRKTAAANGAEPLGFVEAADIAA